MRVAILIPCFNEEATVASVVRQFRDSVPRADIYVYDNNSTDRTAQRATDAGAIVRNETYQGKGNVVRRMFADIDADAYLLVDGDGTYDASAAPELIAKIRSEGLDFVNCARVTTADAAYRRGHRLGNAVLTGMVRFIFGAKFTDMLSGYKAVSRRFAKSFPAQSTGFEIETELTVHALELRMPCDETSAPYVERPPGSVSKLRTYRDGWRILMLIAKLIKDERPLQFFGLLGICSMLLSLVFGVPVIVRFFETGLVPGLPSAVLASALMLIGFLSILTGTILQTVTLARREIKRMAYLATAPTMLPQGEGAAAIRAIEATSAR